MRVRDITNTKPEVISHVYWKEKAAFQVQVDINDFWVVFGVEDGSFTYSIGPHEGTASFGDLVFCPPGVAFQREMVHPLSFHVFLLRWVHEEDGALLTEDNIPAGKVTVHDLHRLTSTYTYLRKWTELHTEASTALRHHFVTDIWMQVVEEWQSDSRTPSGEDILVQKAIAYMLEHAASSFNLKQLAMELGLTQVQFTRRFKKTTGMAPLDYLTSLRLQKVQKLLLDSDLTLQQIAGRCGFENEFYLSRVFKKRMRITPSHYRKLHRL
ncbi:MULTISPECIES: AraC family transcriptional regulator [Paenibacillus]|uniref:AraC family transcriptional regulator n=1 Tax=Paenibacillus violae TaxID=3077234 RepID=A0ABU3RIY3_9BACL|nr:MULTISPECIES: AraC family transcriptional regulator [Paenibacillus]MDU0204235.1 AraC family transcriptional regulator [Paenibacillus sp. PFR10]MEC0266472.1 AraC family transcriptional regulator [Paenibacillus anseongense]